MATVVCIPVMRVRCRVYIDKGRSWTPVEELLLWAITRRAQSIADLASASNLPHQVVVTALSRLNRFRLCKVVASDGAHKFQASMAGQRAVAGGGALPFFPKTTETWIGFVIERHGGRILATREVNRVRARDLREMLNGPVSRRPVVIEVNGSAVGETPEELMARIAQFVAKGRDERLAKIEPGTASIVNEHIAVTVENGIVRDLPDKAGPKLRELVIEAAARQERSLRYSVPGLVLYEKEGAGQGPTSCAFSADDIVIGGSAQLQKLSDLLRTAATRVVMHSTFISLEDIERLLPDLRAACSRDVAIDILWGAAHGEDEKNRYGETASRLAALARNDPVLRGRLHVALQSTGSHAKLLLLDTLDGEWIAAVSSCNWLKSPFRSVEITTLLRHPHLVAGVASALQRLCGERALADAVASELALLALELREARGQGGNAEIKLVFGDDHQALLRQASGAAQQRLVVGTHRLGATARPGMLLPAEAAAGGTKLIKVLYSMTSGPLKNRHARELREEAAAHGVDLLHLRPIPLHGKFLLWDSDDIVTTSLNWGSASTDEGFPHGDVGVHIHAAGIGDAVMAKLTAMLPQLQVKAEAAAE